MACIFFWCWRWFFMWKSWIFISSKLSLLSITWKSYFTRTNLSGNGTKTEFIDIKIYVFLMQKLRENKKEDQAILVLLYISEEFFNIEIINQYSICENGCSFSTLLEWKRTSPSPFFVAQILSTDFPYCCLSFLSSRLHHQFSSNCIKRVSGNN